MSAIGRGRRVKNRSKLLTDSTKKLPTWERGVSKFTEKLLTPFKDGHITHSRFHHVQKEIFFLSKPKNLKTITIFIGISVHFESWIFYKRAVSSEVFTFQGRMFHNRIVSIVVVFWSTRHYDKAITMGWNLIWVVILIYY